MVNGPFVSPALLADPNPARSTLALINARLFAGTGSPVQKNAKVVVEDGFITKTSEPHDVLTIDLDGRFLMPGQIDVHTHLAEQPDAEIVEVVDRDRVPPL